MASGLQMTAFLDFISGTGVGRLTTPGHPLQLVNRHKYLWPRLWNNNKQPVDGGQNLKFWFIPKGGGTFEEVLVGSTTIPTNPQVLQTGTADWRFTRAHSSYADPEIVLNDKVMYGTRDAQFEQFVKIRDEKAAVRKIDVAEGLENQLFAVPDASKMEGNTTTNMTSPYSIFAHINQGTTGLFGSGFTVTPAGGAWTVKQAITPGAAAINSNQSPTIQKYSEATIDKGTNIIGGLDGLWMGIDWEQPDSLDQYKADETLNNIMFITTKQGRQAVMSLIRGDNDRYSAGPQDPSCPDPQFRGIPLMRVDGLETAAVYDGASVLQTEGNAAGTQFKGPRIYAINGNFMFPVCNTDRMFYVDPPMRALNVPDTWVQYETTWWNFICKSYKHQGLLAPSADVYISAGTGGNLYA